MDESPETSRSVHPNSLDIEKLLLEAKHRWLSPDEICEILRNYRKLQIASEPSNKPPSGSLFLFDRKVKRNVRKDGHNWQRQENGKLAKEGHKKLKAGGIEVLHCYYGLGEENKNFQRRCYSMLEKDFSHIVLVHYLELTVTEKIMPNSEIDGSSSSGSHPDNCLEPSENTDRYLDGAQPLERENAQPAIPGTDLAPTQSDEGKSDNHAEAPVYSLASIEVELLKDDSDQSFSSFLHPNTVDEFLSADFDKVLDLEQSQIPAESKVTEKIMPNSEIDDSLSSGSRPNNCLEPSENTDRYLDSAQPLERENAQSAIPGIDSIPTQSDKDKSDNDAESTDDWFAYLDFSSGEETEKIMPNSEIGGSMSSGSCPDNCPEVSEITDMCLNGAQALERENARSGVPLCCHAPIHESGRVPSCVTSRNRLACNEVQEFEYWVSQPQDINAAENFSDSANAILFSRFDKILSLGSSFTNSVSRNLEVLLVSPLGHKIDSLLKEGIHERGQLFNTSSGTEFSSKKLREQVPLKTLKGKLRQWLLKKVAERGKGLSILDEGGLGVLHLAAALGYDWALKPTIVAGVSVDFRDVNGWTTLHWAASCGREITVATLISLGADPRALTYPSPEYPLGRTPADLASANGHKKIAVYLGKRPLGVRISSINLDNQDDVGLGNTSDGPSLSDMEKFAAGKSSTQSDTMDQFLSNNSLKKQEFVGQPEMQDECQMHPNAWIDNSMENGCQAQLSNRAYDYVLPNDSDGYLNMEGKSIYPSAIRQYLLDGFLTEEGLEKLDNFIPWMSEMSEEIGGVTDLDESLMQYSAGVNRETVWNRNGIAGYLADRSLDVHIPSINLDHHNDAAGPKEVQKISEISAEPLSLGNASDCQSRKDLAATIFRCLDRGLESLKFLKEIILTNYEYGRPHCKDVSPILACLMLQEFCIYGISAVENLSEEEEEGKEEEGQEEEGQDGEGPEGERPEEDDGPEKDEGPEKKKEEGKKRAADPALGSGKAYKILKGYSAYMALVTAYYNVQSMETMQMLVLVCVEASKKTGERKLSYIDDGYEPSAIRV